MKKILVLIIVTLLLLVSFSQNIDATNQHLNNSVLKKSSKPIKENILDKVLNFMRRVGHMPSLSACVIKDDEVVWKNSYGHYDLKNNKKASNDTIYGIGSITKTFIATSILQLYEKDQIDLDENVSKYLPFDLKNPNFPDVNITLRMLLSHKSSLLNIMSDKSNNHLNFFEYISYIRDLSDHVRNQPYDNIDEWVNEYYSPNGSRYDSEMWADYSPGKYANYSNEGFVILGYLLEQISGQTYQQYCQENIFDPLGMNDTSFTYTTLDSNRLAVPYYWISGLYLPIEQYDLSGAGPAGGLKSTIDDLSKYLIAHMNNGTYKGERILENQTVELMHTLHAEKGGKSGYGFGWKLYLLDSGDIEEGHSGGIEGYLSHMFMRRNTNVGVIIFYNEYLPSPVFKGWGPLELFTYQNIMKILFYYGEHLN